MANRRGLAVSLCVALAACGGGGGGSVPAPSAVATSAPGGSGSPASNAVAAATLSVSFQQYTPLTTSGLSRRPAFVSPATQSMTLTVVSVNGSPVSNGATVTFNVGAGAQNCANAAGITTCTVSLNVPVGNVVLSAKSFSGTNGGGSTLGSALVPEAIAQNATNRIALALGGNIASIQLYLSATNFSTGTAATALAVIVPLDSSGAQIVVSGNYNPAIVVTSSDVTGHFSLVLDGTNAGNSATVASPTDQVVLNYDGVGAPTSNIKATAGSVSSTVAVRAGLPALGGALAGNTSSTPRHFQFASIGQTGTITPSGGTPPYTIASSDATVATVAPGAGSGPFTVTATGYGVGGTGTATITLTDSAAGTTTFNVTVVPPPLAIAVNSCGTQAACATTSITFPRSPPGGPAAQETGTIGLSGGIGTYTYVFATSGTTTSSYANVTVLGNAFTITPTGAGNDALVFTSGSQTALYPIITSNPFASAFPAAYALCVGKAYTSPAFTMAASSGVVSSGSLASFAFNAIPQNFTATPTLADSPLGAFTFQDAAGDTAIVPFELFTVALGAYNGAAIGAAAEEAFTGIGQTDTVTIGQVAGTLTAVSTNSNIVTANAGATVAGTAPINLTSVATGIAGVTFTDTTTGASVTLSVSVTTNPITILGHGRKAP